jgi:aminopeptidase S
MRCAPVRTCLGIAVLCAACGSSPLVPSTSTTAAPRSAVPASRIVEATPVLTELALQDLVDPADLEAHLLALQATADDALGDGTRATGTFGFESSVRYVERELHGAGYTVDRQEFTAGGAVSWNLVAERGGTGDGVVILGAHLDSVAAGPGMNDNATGVAALLVLAEALVRLPPPAAAVRFAFWGAEEGGPFGSQAYVDALDPDELAEVRAYLNFDMLGSPNAVTFVYDEAGAAPGSAAVANVMAGFFDRRGFPWDPVDLEGDSDHGPFIAAGIPTGGLFAGGIEPVNDAQAARYGAVAGEPADPCSHRACDTLANIDLATLGLMTDAIAYALVVLASEAG